MSHRHLMSIAALPLLLLAGCSSATEPTTADSSILVANATTGPVDVWVDGRQWVVGLSMNGLSYVLALSKGDHRFRISDARGTATELSVEATPEARRTLVAHPSGSGSASGPAIAVLDDTSTWVPFGKSKLRVANLAANAGAIEIRRSQPDFPAGSLIMTPFPFNVTSPYLQSEPG